MDKLTLFKQTKLSSNRFNVRFLFLSDVLFAMGLSKGVRINLDFAKKITHLFLLIGLSIDNRPLKMRLKG